MAMSSNGRYRLHRGVRPTSKSQDPRDASPENSYTTRFTSRTPTVTRTVLRHGYGTGLVAVDLRTGVLSSCPRWPEPERKPDYSIFWTVIPGPHGQSALVQTVDGWMRWLIGAGVESICSRDFTLFRLSEDYVW